MPAAPTLRAVVSRMFRSTLTCNGNPCGFRQRRKRATGWLPPQVGAAGVRTRAATSADTRTGGAGEGAGCAGGGPEIVAVVAVALLPGVAPHAFRAGAGRPPLPADAPAAPLHRACGQQAPARAEDKRALGSLERVTDLALSMDKCPA